MKLKNHQSYEVTSSSHRLSSQIDSKFIKSTLQNFVKFSQEAENAERQSNPSSTRDLRQPVVPVKKAKKETIKIFSKDVSSQESLQMAYSEIRKKIFELKNLPSQSEIFRSKQTIGSIDNLKFRNSNLYKIPFLKQLEVEENYRSQTGSIDSFGSVDRYANFVPPTNHNDFPPNTEGLPLISPITSKTHIRTNMSLSRKLLSEISVPVSFYMKSNTRFSDAFQTSFRVLSRTEREKEAKIRPSSIEKMSEFIFEKIESNCKIEKVEERLNEEPVKQDPKAIDFHRQRFKDKVRDYLYGGPKVDLNENLSKNSKSSAKNQQSTIRCKSRVSEIKSKISAFVKNKSHPLCFPELSPCPLKEFGLYPFTLFKEEPEKGYWMSRICTLSSTEFLFDLDPGYSYMLLQTLGLRKVPLVLTNCDPKALGEGFLPLLSLLALEIGFEHKQ